VRQRLRLGAAAPELITAYRDGALALDQPTAFCVNADVERQRQVFEQMGARGFLSTWGCHKADPPGGGRTAAMRSS